MLHFWQTLQISTGRVIQQLAMLCLVSWPSLAATAEPGAIIEEYNLKAAFIYNFTQFIEWPASAFASENAPFNICVMGRNRFGEILETLEKRNYKGHPLVVDYPKAMTETRACKIIYIHDPLSAGIGHGFGSTLGTAPVLTISGNGEAMEDGFGIGFVSQNGRVRLVLNLDATSKAQLKLRSKLIEVAVTVMGEVKR